DGRLDKGFGCVPEFSSAAALPQGCYALRRRSRARRLRTLDATAARTTARRDLAASVSQSRRAYQQDEPLLLARRAKAFRKASLDGECARSWHMGLHQALSVQARLPRRLGGFRHRVGKFRRHVLPLRQALRGNESLVIPAERAPTATLRFARDIRGRCRRCGGARARDISEGAMIPYRPEARG